MASREGLVEQRAVGQPGQRVVGRELSGFSRAPRRAPRWCGRRRWRSSLTLPPASAEARQHAGEHGQLEQFERQPHGLRLEVEQQGDDGCVTREHEARRRHELPRREPEYPVHEQHGAENQRHGSVLIQHECASHHRRRREHDLQPGEAGVGKAQVDACSEQQVDAAVDDDHRRDRRQRRNQVDEPENVGEQHQRNAGEVRGRGHDEPPQAHRLLCVARRPRRQGGGGRILAGFGAQRRGGHFVAGGGDSTTHP